jgi:hypothetical protein
MLCMIAKSHLWLVRGLAMVFALLLLSFSLDAFDQESGFCAWAGFFLHSVPTLFLVLTIYASWHREWVGAMVFTLVSMLYLASVGWTPGWQTRAWIGGPALVIGLLYGLAWRNKCRV